MKEATVEGYDGRVICRLSAVVVCPMDGNVHFIRGIADRPVPDIKAISGASVRVTEFRHPDTSYRDAYCTAVHDGMMVEIQAREHRV